MILFWLTLPFAIMTELKFGRLVLGAMLVLAFFLTWRHEPIAAGLLMATVVWSIVSRLIWENVRF